MHILATSGVTDVKSGGAGLVIALVLIIWAIAHGDDKGNGKKK